MKITLNGIVFDPTGAADGNGVNWLATGLEGWDSPPLRQATVDPTARHGTVIAKTLLAARPMTLSGVVKAPTLALHYQSQRALNAAAASFLPVQMKVEEDIEREIGVVRAGPLRMRPAGLRAFTFELPLTAPDPLKYALTPTVLPILAGATGTATNAGNYTSEAWVLTASAEGQVKVKNATFSDRYLLTHETVAASTTFDGMDRTVTSDARPNYGALSPTSIWWGLFPGANTVTNDSTISVSVSYRSAWL